MTHNETAGLLTEFLQGTITGSAARDIGAHMQECAECASVAATFHLLKTGIPHPLTEEIATLSLAADRLDPAARRQLEEHVATCTSCSQEIEITRDAAGSFEAARVASRWKWPHALALAASIAALLLAYPALRAIRDLPGLEAESIRLGEENRRLGGESEGLRRSLVQQRMEDDARRAWAGSVRLTVLSAPSRGEAPVKTICVKEGQPAVLLAVLPPASLGTRADIEYRFRVDHGDGSSAWMASMTSGEIKRSVGDAGVVTFLIPSPLCPPGRYVLSLRELGATSTLLEAPFAIAREGEPGSQCQSPAATNAPQ